MKGMRYPSLRMDSTQESAPTACQCLQCADRHPPTRNSGGTPPGGFFLAPFRLPPEPPEADEKGASPLRPCLFRPCWVEEDEGAVDVYDCDQGIPQEKTVMEILQKTVMGIPQENTVMGIPLMEIPQKTVMGITQEKTVMGIPQSIHHQRRNGTNSDA